MIEEERKKGKEGERMKRKGNPGPFDLIRSRRRKNKKKGNHEEGREYPRIGPSAFSHGFESKRDVTARGYHISSVLRKM